MNIYDLTGKVAVVTGARRGIGMAIAQRLAASGAATVVTDVDLNACEQVTAALRAAGRECLAVRMDITSEDDVRAAMENVRARLGRIDILVNNAGIYIAQEIDAMKTEDIDREIAVNLRGALLCIKHVLPGMRANRYGKIVNIASIAGLVGFPESTVYSATKGGLVTMTKELALNLGRYHINVNAIAPGVIETPMSAGLLQDEAAKQQILQKVPYGRIGTPADIANGAAFLASDDSEYITGAVLVIDGGWLSS
jgi:NAD(P)-dependent dehydrogenase (short-subunit alcohol dehydrogenase family)